MPIQLVGVDLDALRRMGQASRDAIVAQMPEAQMGGGWHPDLVAP